MKYYPLIIPEYLARKAVELKSLTPEDFEKGMNGELIEIEKFTCYIFKWVPCAK